MASGPFEADNLRDAKAWLRKHWRVKRLDPGTEVWGTTREEAERQRVQWRAWRQEDPLLYRD